MKGELEMPEAVLIVDNKTGNLFTEKYGLLMGVTQTSDLDEKAGELLDEYKSDYRFLAGTKMAKGKTGDLIDMYYRVQLRKANGSNTVLDLAERSVFEEFKQDMIARLESRKVLNPMELNLLSEFYRNLGSMDYEMKNEENSVKYKAWMETKAELLGIFGRDSKVKSVGNQSLREFIPEQMAIGRELGRLRKLDDSELEAEYNKVRADWEKIDHYSSNMIKIIEIARVEYEKLESITKGQDKRNSADYRAMRDSLKNISEMKPSLNTPEQLGTAILRLAESSARYEKSHTTFSTRRKGSIGEHRLNSSISLKKTAGLMLAKLHQGERFKVVGRRGVSINPVRNIGWQSRMRMAILEGIEEIRNYRNELSLKAQNATFVKKVSGK